MRDDTEFIAAVLSGDHAAFDSLVRRHKSAVYGLALSFVKDFDTAYDLSQEVFLRAYLRLADLQDPDRFPAWLRAITANTCRTYLRQPREKTGLDDIDLEEKMNAHRTPPEMPDEALERRETRRLVLRALSRLSPEYREALTLHYQDDRSSADIARFLELSPAAVRQRLVRGRKQLKKEILHMVRQTLKGETPGDEFDRELQQLLDQVRKLFDKAEYRQAIDILEQARQKFPDDTVVTFILADAHHRRSREDDTAYGRACQLLEDLIDREPDNLLARIKLAELHSTREPFDQLESEHRELLRLTEGTPFEPLALLRMARLYNPRRRHDQALHYCHRLIDREPRFTAIAELEIGVSYYLREDFPAAIEHLERAIGFLEAQSPRYLRELGKNLFDERLVRFGEQEDDRQPGLEQNHTWLAVLHAKNGDREKARLHLRAAVDYLDRRELQSMRPVLVQELLHRVESSFPELADEPEIQGLRNG